MKAVTGARGRKQGPSVCAKRLNVNMHTTAIIDRTLIHKDIAMAITDRPAAHEQVRSLTAWQCFHIGSESDLSKSTGYQREQRPTAQPKQSS